MIGALVLIGLITLAFGVFTREALGDTTAFVWVHLIVGGGALFGAAILALTRVGRSRQPALVGPTLRAIGVAAATIGACLVAYAAIDRADIRMDWTFEGRFQLSEATDALLDEIEGPLSLRLYRTAGDPRTRNTRLLLEEFARGRDIDVTVLDLDDSPEDEDRYGIGSSNSVVIETDRDWALVERPSEGGLYEALSGLVRLAERIVYVTVGAGEGDLEQWGALGYSGLRAALESEGYALRPLPLALAADIPPDATAVIAIAPRRGLPEPALSALRQYLDAGGRLVAFLQPDVESGLEALLADYGITALPGFVIDPLSGPLEGDPAGRNPIASAYATHPVTHGLERNRMTFFRGARSFGLRKAEPDDRLRAVVLSSGDAWVDTNPPTTASGGLPSRPADARSDYQPLVVTAELERGGDETRIVVFGDADLASNRYLRTLYNLDLVLNAVHWAAEQPSAIAIRPKSGGRELVQFPVPLQQSIQALYGIGLLIPELLLLAGGLVWLRARGA